MLWSESQRVEHDLVTEQQEEAAGHLLSCSLSPLSEDVARR